MWSPEKFLVSNMLFFHGAVRVHHFWDFSQNGLARNCLRDNFGKCGAQENSLSATCGFFMVLSGCIIFAAFPKMVWPEIALGAILENVEPRKSACQQHVNFSWCCQAASFLYFFQHGLARNCLVVHFWKMQPRGKPYKEYVDIWCCCKEDMIMQEFSNMALNCHQGIILF